MKQRSKKSTFIKIQTCYFLESQGEEKLEGIKMNSLEICNSNIQLRLAIRNNMSTWDNGVNLSGFIFKTLFNKTSSRTRPSWFLSKCAKVLNTNIKVYPTLIHKCMESVIELKKNKV